MKIVMVNMNPYSEWIQKDIPNRNRHVLFQLLDRDDVEEVVAVDFLPFTKKRAARIFLEDIILGKGAVEYRTAFDVMRKVSDKLHVFSSVRTEIGGGESVFCDSLNEALEKIGFDDYVLWSYNPYFVSYFDRLHGVSQKVFDTVDNWAVHPNFVNDAERLQKNYRYIDTNCDVIFTVAESLLDLYPKNNNVHWISNGVDVAHFQNENIAGSSEIFATLDLLTNPIVGYVGIVQKRVDFDLLKKIALIFPKYDFVFVGDVWPDAGSEIVSDLSNVHFLGRVSYSELPAVLRRFSVGMIPHKVDEFTDSMNPLKLYEYLAAGLPVLSTPVAGVGDFVDQVTIGGFSEWERFLNQIDFNDQDIQSRIDSVIEFSWQKKVDTMISYVST